MLYEHLYSRIMESGLKMASWANAVANETQQLMELFKLPYRYALPWITCSPLIIQSTRPTRQ